MNREKWKPFYQKRGKYADGRERICIAWYEEGLKKKTLMLPKPEELRVLLQSTQKPTKLQGEQGVPQNHALSDPLVHVD